MPSPLEEKKLLGLIADIVAYIRYLRDEVSLIVSVHQIDPSMHIIMPEMVPVNIHICTYCTFMHEKQAIARACVKWQKVMLRKLAGEPFFGTCWLGVGEYVVPLTDRSEKVIGFISVSGYRGNKQNTKEWLEKVCDKWELDREKALDAQRSLIPFPKEYKRIFQLISPLRHMFTLLESYLESFGPASMQTDIGRSETFDAVSSYLRTHFATEYKLSDLASLFSVSESTLSKMFREYAGCSYRKYINRLRTGLARYYLSLTDMSVRAMSEMLGYATPNYFISVFQKECGMTPVRYRELHRKKPTKPITP